MRTEEAVPVRLADYRPPDWLVETVDLDIALDPTRTRVRARLKLKPNPQAAAPAALSLDGDELRLISVKLDGKPLAADAFVATADRLTVLQPPPQGFTLETETEIDPSANTKLMGLYRSGNGYTTQCEAQGFRRITYFPDRPDVMAVFTTRIEADKAEAPILLANGNLVGAGEVAEANGAAARHYAIWRDPFPKPCYLFAMVGGTLGVVEDSFTTMSGRNVALKIFVEPGKERRADYAMGALKRAMRWDEEAFGREYDLDVFMIVAVSYFNMGAMENKGLNIFNDKNVLASAETAMTPDFNSIEAVIAHSISTTGPATASRRDWFQLCLGGADRVSRPGIHSISVRGRSSASPTRGRCAATSCRGAQPPGPSGAPKSIARSITLYCDGHEKAPKWCACSRPCSSAALPAPVRTCTSSAMTGAPRRSRSSSPVSPMRRITISQFMLWYSQAGTPELAVQGNYDAAARTYSLEITQIDRRRQTSRSSSR
jgi:aminopeptidase N